MSNQGMKLTLTSMAWASSIFGCTVFPEPQIANIQVKSPLFICLNLTNIVGLDRFNLRQKNEKIDYSCICHDELLSRYQRSTIGDYPTEW